MVCADLKRLISPHHQPCLLVLAVLQKPHITSAALFPLSAVTVKAEELCAHLEDLLLLLLVCLDVNLLRKVDNGFKVHINFTFRVPLLIKSATIANENRAYIECPDDQKSIKLSTKQSCLPRLLRPLPFSLSNFQKAR